MPGPTPTDARHEQATAASTTPDHGIAPASTLDGAVPEGHRPDQDNTIDPPASTKGTYEESARHVTYPTEEVDRHGHVLEEVVSSSDPLSLARRRHNNVSRQQMKIDHPGGNEKKLKKYYVKQNELIDQFLGSSDEERLAVVEEEKMGPKVRFAVNASFAVNFFLFVIQVYAAVSTGSLSLFATAADAFVSSWSIRQVVSA
jgi:hypothetical protein